MIRPDENFQIQQNIPYSFIQEIQRKSDIPAPYLIFSLIFASVLVSSGYFAQSLTSIIIFVLPVYWTLKAVELRLKNEDKQWITYWLFWMFFYFLDLIFSNFFKKIPNFYLIKLLFFIWLFLPSTMGAQYLYYNFFSSYSDKFDINLLTGYFDNYKRNFTEYIKEKFGINIKDYELRAEMERKKKEAMEKEKTEGKTSTINEQHESRQNIVSNAKIDMDNLQANLQNVKEQCRHTIDELRGERVKESVPLKQEQLIQEGRFIAGHPVIEEASCTLIKKVPVHITTVEKIEEKKEDLENRKVQ
jgi:receptor expression-enhancing protein 5/6